MLNTPESLLTSIFYICYFAYVIEMKEKRKEADWCTNLLPEAVYHLILSCIPVQSKVFWVHVFLFIYFKGTSPPQKSFCLHTLKELTLSKLILSKKAGLSPTGRGDHNKNSQIKDFVKNTPVIYFQFTILLHQWG